MTGDCEIPNDVAISALQGHYADLSKFAMAPYRFFEQDRISVLKNVKQLTVTSKMHPKPISNYQQWLTARSNYEQFSDSMLPPSMNIYNKCADDKRLIHVWQAKYKWPAIFVYDCKFRLNLVKVKSFNFEDFMQWPSFCLYLRSPQ